MSVAPANPEPTARASLNPAARVGYAPAVATSPELALPKPNPVIRLLSSPWFGVTLLALIVIYASIMSAYPPVRWALELTDMSAFRHPLFATLGALFFVALLAAAFFRTRWTALNAGALITHLGLLMLTAGTFLYFSTKIEGDVKLYTPAVEVGVEVDGQVIGLAEASEGKIDDRFPARAGETWTGGGSDLPLRLDVTDTTAARLDPVSTVTLAARALDAPARPLTLSVADPNWQPLDLSVSDPNWQPILEHLRIRFRRAEPQTRFYEHERPALYFRNVTTPFDVECDISGLPIHRDRYLPDPNETVEPKTGALRDNNGRPVPSYRTRPELNLFGLHIPTGWFETWRLPIRVADPQLPFDVEITGYDPYVIGLNHTAGGRHVPILEPLDRRDPGIDARSMSAIRVRVTDHDASHTWLLTDWMPHKRYPHDPDDQIPPLTIRLPNGQVWEAVYSRASQPLGAPLAAERLTVTHTPGNGGIAAFFTHFLYARQGGDPQPGDVYTNHTFKLGPWSLYQSGYDSTHEWEWTILGVGNFNGIWLWSVGWIAVVAGALYAFYVKPLLLRRLKSRAAR